MQKGNIAKFGLPVCRDAAPNIWFGQGFLAQIFLKLFIILSLQNNTPVNQFLNLCYNSNQKSGMVMHLKWEIITEWDNNINTLE